MDLGNSGPGEMFKPQFSFCNLLEKVHSPESVYGALLGLVCCEASSGEPL